VTESAVLLAGNEFGPAFFDALNSLSTTRYEQRVGLGRIILAAPESGWVGRTLTLKEPVPTNETRTLRKLLEMSGSRASSLLTDGTRVFGLGEIKPDYDSDTEAVFEVLVLGHGSWELRHDGTPLMSVTNGAPRLPEQRLRRERFDDIASRVFANSGGCDLDALWSLAAAAADAEHGTMLVVSANAATEALRLHSQALEVEATMLDVDLVRQVTSIDGAVLVDPTAACHGIGVILDGTATTVGDRARGARYNSAVKYQASAQAATMIILVSEDGMINLLPDLRPRIRRSELVALMAELRDAAAIEPVHPERFYKVYERVRSLSFYLSADQCAEANALREDHWTRRMAEGAQIRVTEQPLVPDPEMSDEFLID
jgi:hypothetical protein